MGFVSLLEDISDRYLETCPLSGWDRYLGPKPAARDWAEARDLFRPQLDRRFRLLRDFRIRYGVERQGVSAGSGRWAAHVDHLRGLTAILTGVRRLGGPVDADWARLREIEDTLHAYLRANPFYGTLSRSTVEAVAATTRQILQQCEVVRRELDEAVRELGRGPNPPDEWRESAEGSAWLGEVKQELDRVSGEVDALRSEAETLRELGRRFLDAYLRLAVDSRRRPVLQELSRLRLEAGQDRLVGLNYEGAYRVQGASGSGKTVILLHRAIRLAVENPGRVVRVFTINRSLADLLRASVVTIHGSCPGNLHVSALYDFLVGALSIFEDVSGYRLLDDRSGERIVTSWRDFFAHRGRTSRANVFATPDVREMVTALSRRGAQKVNVDRYLRDEMTFIQGGYAPGERDGYAEQAREPRTQRGLTFTAGYRRLCLEVLGRWEEWLAEGGLCDIDGLTGRAARYVLDEAGAARVRQALPTDHVLCDEFQDFSTLELRLVRRLVPDPDGPNAVFLAGDLNQKVFAKHFRPRAAGFDFRGRSEILRQNFRNTRQILRAAYRLPQAYPPPADREWEVSDPELSHYEGGPPVVIGRKLKHQVRLIWEIARRRLGTRVAVVSNNEDLLRRVRVVAGSHGCECYELFCLDDLDRWREQTGDAVRAGLVLSKLEAVKGFEFDTVILGDVSEHQVPAPGTPPEECWREAAALYAALTRARDELVITYTGRPSPFLLTMRDEVEWFENDSAERLEDFIQGYFRDPAERRPDADAVPEVIRTGDVDW